GLGNTPVPAGLLPYGGSFTGSGGSDTFYFVGGNSGHSLGHVALAEPSGTTGEAVDFSNFLGGGINLDLNAAAEQAVSPGNLWLTLPSATAVTTAIGSPASDTIIGH